MSGACCSAGSSSWAPDGGGARKGWAVMGTMLSKAPRARRGGGGFCLLLQAFPPPLLGEAGLDLLGRDQAAAADALAITLHVGPEFAAREVLRPERPGAALHRAGLVHGALRAFQEQAVVGRIAQV